MLEHLTDDTLEARIAATEQGLCLFFKTLCPHCKNMEKVLEKFHAAEPDVALFAIDSEENPVCTEKFDAARVPTLLLIKKGAVVSSKSGLMNPRELRALYADA